MDLQCLVRTASGRRMQQSAEMPVLFHSCGSGPRARTSELGWFGGLHTRERSPLPAARPAHSWWRDLAAANAGGWARAGCAGLRRLALSGRFERKDSNEGAGMNRGPYPSVRGPATASAECPCKLAAVHTPRGPRTEKTKACSQKPVCNLRLY